MDPALVRVVDAWNEFNQNTEENKSTSEDLRWALSTFIQKLKNILSSLENVENFHISQPWQQNHNISTSTVNMKSKPTLNDDDAGDIEVKQVASCTGVQHAVDRCNNRELGISINKTLTGTTYTCSTSDGWCDKMDISEATETKLRPTKTNDSEEVAGTTNSSTVDSSTINLSTKDSSTKDLSTIDPKLVQIKASKTEIDRRISAFIEKKQMEVNDMNRREFCPVFTHNSDEQSDMSCARTDAVFIPRTGCKSHVKVSRVVNMFGPQTVPGYTDSNPRTSRSMHVKSEPKDTSWAIEERLRTIEGHLDPGTSSLSSKDTFSRLKAIENRILFLESLSPEYFTSLPMPRQSKRQRLDYTTTLSTDLRQDDDIKSPYNSLTVEEIDTKMKFLKNKLMGHTNINS